MAWYCVSNVGLAPSSVERITGLKKANEKGHSQIMGVQKDLFVVQPSLHRPQKVMN